ncbi:MAG TPA: argininosuccinate lyase, partial [Candidatus Atribacteria bacterium]|nr:argininosuccinate lyase [Candidatus Atribacteria bacterium]
DQILLDLRLYMKDAIFGISENIVDFLKVLLNFSREYLYTPMPGYTHTRIAMPSSVGLWSHALFDAMRDNIRILLYLYEIIDQSPLGSAAGYGVPVPIDRELVADLLGFSKVQKNVVYVQNSRGKFELLICDVSEQIMIDLSRYATDLIYFTMPQFGYFSLPFEMLSGSSIMPQKQNPDMLELLRAKTSQISSFKVAISGILAKLPTGYSRDLQLTKGYLFSAFDITNMSIKVMNKIFEGLLVHEENLKRDMKKEIFATDYALSMVKDGVPFREAYKRVAKELENLVPLDIDEVIKNRVHIGTPSNLKLTEDENFVEETEDSIKIMKHEFHNRLN